MKLSNRIRDTKMVSYLAKIHKCKGRQDLFIRQKPVEFEGLIEILKLPGSQAPNLPNKIEGIVTTSTRMKQWINDKTTPHNRDETESMGYREVLRMKYHP